MSEFDLLVRIARAQGDLHAEKWLNEVAVADKRRLVRRITQLNLVAPTEDRLVPLNTFIDDASRELREPLIQRR